MKCIRLYLCLAAMSSLLGACGQHQSTNQEDSQGSQAPSVLISFTGKGTMLGWDVGGLKALDESWQLGERSLIFSGNSSGAILAAHFACRGLSSESIGSAMELVRSFDKLLVNEANVSKMFAVLMKQDPSYPHSNMQPLIDKVANGCNPVTAMPIAIVAANNELLEERKNHPGLMSDEKYIQANTNDVVIGDEHLGKACTYFANSSMVTILKRVPYQERQCDIRLVETTEDLKLAMYASVSEPTYFPPVLETKMANILDPVKTQSRWYNGGYVMSVAAQDIKRAVPGIRALGSGRRPFPAPVIHMMRRWLLVDLNEILALNKWWLDLELLPSRSDWRRLNRDSTSHDEAMQLGYERGQVCVQDPSSCQDSEVLRPQMFDVYPGTNEKVPVKQGLL